MKQTDFDGNFSFSNVVAVHIIDKGGPAIYPNPATDDWVIDFSKEESDERLIQLFDLTVRKRFEYETHGKRVVRISRKDLPNGTYVIHIISRKSNFLSQKITFN